VIDAKNLSPTREPNLSCLLSRRGTGLRSRAESRSPNGHFGAALQAKISFEAALAATLGSSPLLLGERELSREESSRSVTAARERVE
jgi:hypothetical protein